jgi:hypothetical protein
VPALCRLQGIGWSGFLHRRPSWAGRESACGTQSHRRSWPTRRRTGRQRVHLENKQADINAKLDAILAKLNQRVAVLNEAVITPGLAKESRTDANPETKNYR